ncbi:amidase [Rubellimicrobium sp. CFH 75288]|uniref:amidase n=1 Tax=Rubellimicrobium sp. CFH 75288 TaxID=2697034 RepID=UPI0014122CF2|nr:amidase [Rubellimicrobium sp. CFH 75288]NAZ36224.1 amidase [Rubellimicrobium sp. CFH 75288]
MAPGRTAAAPEALLGLSAADLRDRIARGALSATELARACLERVRAVEAQVRAWAWLDEGHILAEAERLDALRRSGRPLGPLHGLPVGIKDVIDTRRIPTQNGTPLDAGRVPQDDAAVVRRLLAAGAYVFGKTATTELAFLHPGPTTNPHDPARTPGGSSQGSAAAVAAGMVPLAVGTQTAGSVIRPAAFCGVVGFKPTFGSIARTGVLAQAPSLDTIGVFARDVAGAALLAEALAGDDPADPATAPAPPPRLHAIASEGPPVRPTLAVLRNLPGAELHPDMAGAMDEVVDTLGEDAFTFDLPPPFAEGAHAQETVQLAEMAKTLHPWERRGGDILSRGLREALARGRAVPARDYLAALDWRGVLVAMLDEVFDRCDAILSPAAPGPAPVGLEATGSPACNRLWTFCGLPVATLPLLWSGEGLPMGLQVVGRRWDDGRLLRTARWLETRLGGRGEDES